MRRFAIGDIHGRIKALKDVLNKTSFDYKKDKLILLGDIVDGGVNSKEVVDELLKIKNVIFVVGNHDKWFIDFINNRLMPNIWTTQGGYATLNSYGYPNIKIPTKHKLFFNNAKSYHIEHDMVFIHGGYLAGKQTVEESDIEILTWDRTLVQRAKNGLKIKEWNKVFVGHTSTQIFYSLLPLKYGKLIMLDTGAGWDGKLTIMNIDTEEYWQSDIQIPNI